MIFCEISLLKNFIANIHPDKIWTTQIIYLISPNQSSVVVFIVGLAGTWKKLNFYTAKCTLPMENDVRLEVPAGRYDWKMSLNSLMFRLYAGLLRQFRFILSGPVAALLLVSFWLYFCMITISYYEAKLKSFLTLSHERGTIFTTLDGVLDAIEKKVDGFFVPEFHKLKG